MEVVQLEIQHFSNFLITLSKDLTIRIWDMGRREQVYEFSYPEEDYCLQVSAHPNKLFFAGGFQSGALRIFDIERMCIAEELQYYQTPLKLVKYSVDGRVLVGVDHNCVYTVFNAE